MAKKDVKATAATESTATATESKPLRLVILKKDGKFKGARESWYKRLIAMDGKPRDEVFKSLEDDRPSVYGSKSRHAGKPEPVAGWVRFYERNGYLEFRA